MAQITLPQGIASISGKIGNIVFYFRSGKQYARRLDKRLISTEALSKRCREIIEPLSGVIAPPSRCYHRRKPCQTRRGQIINLNLNPSHVSRE